MVNLQLTQEQLELITIMISYMEFDEKEFILIGKYKKVPNTLTEIPLISKTWDDLGINTNIHVFNRDDNGAIYDRVNHVFRYITEFTEQEIQSDDFKSRFTDIDTKGYLDLLKSVR